MTDDLRRKKICRNVAWLLKHHRDSKGLSMTNVAEKAGLSQQMVSYVERGLRNPSLDTLLRITEALGIDLPELIRQAEE